MLDGESAVALDFGPLDVLELVESGVCALASRYHGTLWGRCRVETQARLLWSQVWMVWMMCSPFSLGCAVLERDLAVLELNGGGEIVRRDSGLNEFAEIRQEESLPGFYYETSLQDT